MSDDTTCYRLGVYQRTEGTLTRHTLSFLCTYNSILFLVTGLSSGKRCHPHKGVLVPRFPHRPRLQENAQPYLRFLNSSDPSTSVTCSELARAQKNTCLQGGYKMRPKKTIESSWTDQRIRLERKCFDGLRSFLRNISQRCTVCARVNNFKRTEPTSS